ncbi:MAG: hypothetical protein RLZZ361_165 [Cyanobacteriota bacterium]|jgi:BirA family biotin operon repressor/biotin-[acetyl-CoA-carboxylase] ligase
MPIFLNYQTLSSTQDQAKNLVKSSEILITTGSTDSDMAIIMASEQTSGRGSYGKSWASPAGAGIYVSFVYNLGPVNTCTDNQALTLKIAELITQALKSEFQNDGFYVKPINDIYFDGSKLAGILVENFSHEQNFYLVVGLGLNVLKSQYLVKEALPGAPKASPIALEEIIGEGIRGWQREDFVKTLGGLLAKQAGL